MEVNAKVIIKLTGYLKVCPGSYPLRSVLWCLSNWDMGHHGLLEDITQFTGITILCDPSCHRELKIPKRTVTVLCSIPVQEMG